VIVDARVWLVLGFIMMAAVPLGADSPSDLVRTSFTVEGMHCDGCSSAIVASLERLDGVVEAVADHEAGTAAAVYRPRTVSLEALEEAIEKLGYTVTGTTTETVER
jgi:copper chaperone CopZ